MMTHLLHAAVSHFEEKPMLKFYDRSNLGGGVLSSVLLCQWKKNFEQISNVKKSNVSQLLGR